MSLVRGMPADEYHAIDAMSASGLRRMLRSPFHFHSARADKATRAKANGTLTHCVMLEPAALLDRYAVVPDDAPRRPSSIQRKAKKPSDDTVAAVRWWDEFEAATAGKLIVDGPALAAAHAQSLAARSLPDIAALLAEGEAEVSALWVDEATGEACRCRPDWTTPAGGDGVILVDGKTCRDASPDGFARSVWSYGYHLQAAWYSDGYALASGQRVHGFVFAAVESEPPYAAAAYMLGDDVLDKARAINRTLLDRYAECRRSGVWPGYSTGIQLLNLPRWANLDEQL